MSVGGAEVHLRELLSGLSRDKYDLELAFFKEEAQEARPMKGDFEALGLPVHDLKGQGRIAPGALFRLAQLIRNRGYDLVHSHLFRADLYGALASLVRPGMKLINSVHNPEDFYTHPAVALLARAAAARQSKTIVISRAVQHHLARYLRLSDQRMELIYYGLSPRPRQGLDLRAEWGLTKDELLIGTVGRLSKQKGHLHLIRAMAQIVKEVPQARLVIVGHDDQGMAGRLEREIRDQGLYGLVTLAGFREEIPDIMAAFDLFVLPSLWEGFGMVLLEAMAEGRATAASRVGSIPEVVVDGRTGVLVPPGDEAALSRAIAQLLKEPETRAVLGRAGQERMETVFSKQAMIQGTEAVYDRLLGLN